MQSQSAHDPIGHYTSRFARPGALTPVVSGLPNEHGAALDSETNSERCHLPQLMPLLVQEEQSADGRAIPMNRRCLLAPWQARRVTSYIEAHLDQSIGLAGLAGISRLSTRYFSVAFRRTFGTTVQTFLAHRRIERAQAMMLSTEQSLTQIALACGFCDQAHFCRRFRRVTGGTPNAWRRQYRRPSRQ